MNKYHHGLSRIERYIVCNEARGNMAGPQINITTVCQGLRSRLSAMQVRGNMAEPRINITMVCQGFRCRLAAIQS